MSAAEISDVSVRLPDHNGTEWRAAADGSGSRARWIFEGRGEGSYRGLTDPLTGAYFSGAGDGYVDDEPGEQTVETMLREVAKLFKR